MKKIRNYKQKLNGWKNKMLGKKHLLYDNFKYLKWFTEKKQ